MWNVVNLALIILAFMSFGYAWKIGQESEAYDMFGWLFIGIVLLSMGLISSVAKYIWN